MIKKLNIKNLLTTAISVLKSNIVEMVLFTIMYIVAMFYDDDFYKFNFIALSSVAIALSYSFNNFFKGGKWRLLYYTAWIFVYIPLLFITKNDWYSSSQAIITSTILSPLLVILCQQGRENNSFVKGLRSLIISLSISSLFAGIMTLLIFAIFESIVEIFSITANNLWDIYTYLYSFVLYIITPLIFFNYSSRNYGDKSSNSTANLINYILSPAILIYAAILYISIFKALILWELPKGGIAYLVFGFTIFTLIVKTLRETVEKRLFSKFFDNFSYIAIPILILFWIGVNERISQYGLTDWRVYLVVCGAIMTICIVMFMTKKYANYYAVTILTFILFATTAFIPYLSASSISYRSQLSVAEKYLEKLGLIGSSGKITTVQQTVTSKEQASQYKSLNSAVNYVMDIDKKAFKEYGVWRRSQILDMLPDDYGHYSDYYDSIYLSFYDIETKIDISNYKYIYNLTYSYDTDHGSNYYDDSDRVLKVYIDDKPIFSIGFDELIENRVNNIIKENKITDPNSDNLTKYKDEIGIYRNNSIMIIFKYLEIDTDNQNYIFKVKEIKIDKILMR